MDVTQSQPKSAAERQAAYRARQHYGTRINLYLPPGSTTALRRLARHRGQSQADVLADLIRAADLEVQDGLADEDADAYFGVTA